MLRLLLIGVGGFAGSVFRYLLGGLAQSFAPDVFPLGTLVVNLAGCLIMGVVAELAEARGFLSSDARAFVVVGLLGGFTTLSAFANETVNALRDGAWMPAAVYLFATVVLGLAAVFVGRALAHMVWG